MKTQLIIAILLLFAVPIMAQDDMMDLFAEEEPTADYTFATFKATKVVIGQSVENPGNGSLVFVIQHHFGRVNTGIEEFFGLDQATTRLGFEYGVNDWLALGLGRSMIEKTYDGSVKAKILRQQTGKRNIPISLSYFGSIAIQSMPWPEPERTNYFSSRISYANQLLIARKFSRAFSLQLIPTHIHRNLVEKKTDDNDVFSLGAGGRLKLSNRISLNAEYHYLLSQQTAEDFHNSFSVGIDIETGGHVFQLFATNSQGIIAQQFIARTDGDWLNGDIHIGFNISRSFQLKKKKQPKD